jgi:hypothetical protein
MSIETKKTASAQEFLEIISPIGELSSKYGGAIYRGQGDAQWKLIPNVCRTDGTTKWFHKSIALEKDFLHLFEFPLLQKFLSKIDDAGIQILGDGEQFRKWMAEIWFQEKFNDNYPLHSPPEIWPPREYINFMALAQHHGIPTRLLDWSFSPYVAAYFAIEQALSSSSESIAADQKQELAVWLVPLFGEYASGFLPNDIELVKVPGGMTKNIPAQRGCFLYKKYPYRPDETFDWGGDKYSMDSNFDSFQRKVYKVTLPYSEIEALCQKLERFSASPAFIYPGLDGAAKAAMFFQKVKDFQRIYLRRT